MAERDRYWNDTLLALSDGNAQTMQSLLEMDCVDFYYFWESWHKRQEQIKDAYKNA